jgi:hypothetical protein
MGSRCLAVGVAVLALSPVAASADQHPLDCFGGPTLSSTKETTVTSSGTTQDGKTALRKSYVSCAGLLVNAEGTITVGNGGPVIGSNTGASTGTVSTTSDGAGGAPNPAPTPFPTPSPFVPPPPHPPTYISVMPTAILDFHFSRDFVNEFMFGVAGFFKKWAAFQPSLRIFVGGVTTTEDERKHGASAFGAALDWRERCPAPLPDGTPAPCRRLRFGARVNVDGVLLWNQPKQIFPRFTARFGLRWEGGKHRPHPHR